MTLTQSTLTPLSSDRLHSFEKKFLFLREWPHRKSVFLKKSHSKIFSIYLKVELVASYYFNPPKTCSLDRLKSSYNLYTINYKVQHIRYSLYLFEPSHFEGFDLRNAIPQPWNKSVISISPFYLVIPDFTFYHLTPRARLITTFWLIIFAIFFLFHPNKVR